LTIAREKSDVPGYSGKPLVTKLGIKPGQRLALVGAPRGFALQGLPDDTRMEGPGAREIDFVMLFVSSRAELVRGFKREGPRLVSNGMLWVCWPKKSSGVKTDMTEDVVREVVLPEGWVDVKVCAVDDTWSGLKIVRRKETRA
jgi:hypothetical protein